MESRLIRSLSGSADKRSFVRPGVENRMDNVELLGLIRTDLQSTERRLRDELLISFRGELREELRSAEERLRGEIRTVEERLLNHIHGVGTELHTQMQALEGRIDQRTLIVEKRLELQGGLLQAGSRAMTRFIEWSESTNMSLSRYDERLRGVEKRLADLDQKSA